MYGICMDIEGNKMKYMIAYNYLPWKRFPDGLELKSFKMEHGQCFHVERHYQKLCRMLLQKSGGNGWKIARNTNMLKIILLNCIPRHKKTEMIIIAKFGYL